MKVRSYKSALLPGTVYICQTCRLQLPYTSYQSRRQQHGEAQPSSSRLGGIVKSVIKSLVGKSRKTEKNTNTVLNTVGQKKPSQDASFKPRSEPPSEPPAEPKVIGPSSFQALRPTPSSMAKKIQHGFKTSLQSPRKPSAEAQMLQRHLHERFVAQRRKDAVSAQYSMETPGRETPPQEGKAKRYGVKRPMTKRARRGERAASDLKKVLQAASTPNVAAQSTKYGKLQKESTPKLESQSDKRADDQAKTKPSKIPGETQSSTKPVAFEQKSSGMGTQDSAMPERIIDQLRKSNTKLTKAKKAAASRPTTLNPTEGKKVPAGLSGVIQEAAALRFHYISKDPENDPAPLIDSTSRERARRAHFTPKEETTPKTAPSRMILSTPKDPENSRVRFHQSTHSTPKEETTAGNVRKMSRPRIRALGAGIIQELQASQLDITPIEMDQPPVPHLSYGLERVLFNPGVYYLQDPRSRVFNFDPYLQSIMPVAEFDYDALKEYITSSRDTTLKEIANAHKKRYVGSSSSMTGILSHFHFLLSQWRDINTNMLSREFPEKNVTRFTEIQRTPSAIILKWQDGAYAIDADKEFANANVLMSLGKSMEKLLTLRTEDFEKYRKSNPANVSTEEQNAPESYHYSTMGDFLMRSQLDAHDPRLPGTGMFDLKTRAVVSVRMDTTNYEEGKGYQIKSRQGAWESFEREYFDMIRAAFLKYSLQVRMGRMDGIFVAFHNTDRIFGFQYVSLAEMDSTLHSQWDTSLGDQEFKLSLALLNEVLNKATKKYPNTSLRLHFETREAQTPFMYIFAEPVTEEQITAIQTANDAKIQEIEQRIFGQSTGASDSNEEDQGWHDLHANVRDSMDQDILDPNHDDRRKDLKPVLVESSRRLDGGKSTLEAHPSESSAGTSGTPLYEEEEEEGRDEEEEDEKEEEEEEGEGEVEEIREEDGEGEKEVKMEGKGEEPNADEELRVEPEDAVKDEARLEGEGDQDLDSQETTSEQASAEDTSKGSGDDAVDQKHEHQLDGDGSSKAQGVPEESEESDALERVSGNKTKSSEKPVEDASEPSSNEFATNADVPFLKRMTKKEESRPNGKEVLAMTLTVRNKVNNGYVLRPNDLGPKDKWSIEYSLNEVSDPDRAWQLYQACQLRRRKKLDDAARNAETEHQVNHYIGQLREMSRQGAQWRKKQDEQEKALPVKVLGQTSEAEKK